MSYVLPYYSDEVALEAQAAPVLPFVARSKLQWIPLLFPVALTGASWMSGGSPAITDMGFLIFSILCSIYLLQEFWYFPRRFGIGGLVLWGGVLAWFCQDYFTHWFHHDYTKPPLMSSMVVAKAAFFHVTFVMFMSIGLGIEKGRWALRALQLLPDPGDNRFYLWVMLALAAVGISPYFLFNGPSQPWYSCMYHAMFAGWVGQPEFTVYRTGNLNYNWGGYVAQIMQVGEVSGIVSIVYAILIAPSILLRLLGMTIWTFYALVAFETGRRGNIAFHLLPPIALLFIKYQAQAANLFKKFSIKAFLVCGVLAVGMQAVVQFQGTFRSSGYASANLAQLDITANQGNTMFSEGLLGYALIPDAVPFVYSSHFPGEGAFVALPKTLFDFLIGPIPRALWTTKPVDDLWEWYNNVYQGSGRNGTTISKGLVGSWYFKFGPGGMIEGAILVGWLMGLSERWLQGSEGRPIPILFSLGMSVWLFRTYRDFIFIDLYGLMIGGAVLWFLIWLLRPILGGSTVRQ